MLNLKGVHDTSNGDIPSHIILEGNHFTPFSIQLYQAVLTNTFSHVILLMLLLYLYILSCHVNRPEIAAMNGLNSQKLDNF